VLEHKTVRPHQSLKMATPAERFTAAAPAMAPQTVPAALMTVENKRVGGLVPRLESSKRCRGVQER
jgi:hypothetical protein